MTDISVKYEQLIQDLRKDFRPQREWGEGRGIFLVIGHFVVGIGAGAWLLGLVFNYDPGLVAGFLLCCVGGVAHLGFLGRPERFWRMVTQIKRAWISRGFLGLTFFLIGAVLYLPPRIHADWPWAAQSMPAEIGWWLAGAGMIILIVYMGFVYEASKGIPFWNSPLHPALYIAYAVRGGAAALLVCMAVLGAPSADSIPTILKLWIGITAVVAVLFVLELQGAATGGNEAARQSVKELLAGRMALYFYIGTLAVGLVLPLVLSTGTVAPLSLAILAAVGLLSALGDFFMKYTTIRAGVYLPLKPKHMRRSS